MSKQGSRADEHVRYNRKANDNTRTKKAIGFFSAYFVCLHKNRKFLQNIRSVACTGFPSMLYYPEECQGKEEEHGKERDL